MFRKMDKFYCPDGTLYDPPMDPEYKSLFKPKFPSCKSGGSYNCCFCNGCPLGEYFIWPEEFAPILKRQHDLEREYLRKHGCTNRLDLILRKDPALEKQAG